MPRILLEDTCGEFIVDRSKPLIRENLGSGSSITRIPGRLSVCDTKNGNNRRYPKRVWEKNLAENSALQESIKRNAAFGLLEHPADGKVDLRSNIAVLTTKAQLEGADVTGELTVLNTEDGRKLLALIEAGYNPSVSSRGFGSLTKASDGVDDVQEDYVCEGWDPVMTPSFPSAQLSPARPSQLSRQSQPIISTTESLKESMHAHRSDPEYQGHVKSIRHSAKTGDKDKLSEHKDSLRKYLAAKKIDPNENPEDVEALETECLQLTTPKQPIMDIKTLKESIQALKGQDPAKLAPAQFAENLTKIESLHTEVAKYVAEDATRAYEGHRLHSQLEELEQIWSASVVESRKQGDRAVEHNVKLAKVLKAVTESGLSYKTKLSEKTSLVGKLVERGRAWKRRAEMLERRAETLESKFKLTENRAELAYASLDELVEQYNAATTTLGRRLIEVEFGVKAEADEIKKSLKEATKPKHLVAIREKLEGKPAAASVTEAVVPVRAAAVPAAAVPAAAAVSSDLADPRFMGESLAIVRRLSAAAAVSA